MIAKDTRGEPDGAAEAMEQLAPTRGPSPSWAASPTPRPSGPPPPPSRSGVPLLSLSKVEGITEGRPYVFRLMLTARAQAQALADLAMLRRGLQAGGRVLYPEIPYGTELQRRSGTRSRPAGATVRAPSATSHDRTNFTPLVKELVGRAQLERAGRLARGPEGHRRRRSRIPYRRAKALEKARKELAPIIEFDAIFVPDFARNVTLLAPALAVEDVVTACDPRRGASASRRSARWTVKPVLLLGGNGWDDPAVVEKAGRYVRVRHLRRRLLRRLGAPRDQALRRGLPEGATRARPSILEASAYDAAAHGRRGHGAGGVTGRKELRDGLAAAEALPRCHRRRGLRRPGRAGARTSSSSPSTGAACARCAPRSSPAAPATAP